MSRGHQHISFVFSSAFRDIVPCAVFGFNNDHLFSSLVLEIWSFTVYFSGKRRSLWHPDTAQGSFFPLPSYSRKTLRKNVPKSARKYKRNVLMHMQIETGVSNWFRRRTFQILNSMYMVRLMKSSASEPGLSLLPHWYSQLKYFEDHHQ